MASGSPFARTTCACAACRQCCREQPGPLIPSDLPRLAERFALSVAAFAVRFLVASPGALVKDTKTGRQFRIGTIVPKTKIFSGSCIFLTAEGKCEVHDVAPFGCSHFDVHMAEDEAKARAVWYLRQIGNDPEYRKIREGIPSATTWRPKSWAKEDR